MYTIKQAARLTGVSESSLRAWERRYAVVSPRRTASGYRIYDEESLAALSAMRRLVDAGWSPAEAARRLRDGDASPPQTSPGAPRGREERADRPDASASMERFLRSAARLDAAGVEQSLDQGFALGSFEHVVDTWLFPTLDALGEGWARGEIDVAGEHAASHAVHRRLAAAYEAAGSASRGPSVVVGLPPGSQHELGALAFATALRRRGLDVRYLGANVPVASWQSAVQSCAADAAVLCVVTADDRPPAAEVAERLLAHEPIPLVATGGRAGAHLRGGVTTLPASIGAAAEELDELLHAGRRSGSPA